MLNEVKDEALKRLGHSVLGSFTFYMILFNWKIWIYIFSNMEAKEKIDLVAPLIGDQPSNIFFSLLLTALTMFLIPLIKSKYDRWILDRDYQTKSHQAGLNRKLKADEYGVTNALDVIRRSKSYFTSNELHLKERFKSIRNLSQSNPALSKNKDLAMLYQSIDRESESLMKTIAELKEACDVLDGDIRATERLNR